MNQADAPYLADFHVHTTYCDGKSPAEETVRSAIARGFSVIGFSGHSPMPFPTEWAMTEAGAVRYYEEIQALKEKYCGQINILCGVEMDYFSAFSEEPFDYVIGSVHFIKKGSEYLQLDDSAETTRRNVEMNYHGDFDAYAEDYFALVADLPHRMKLSLVGHFDLLTKFYEAGVPFDATSVRYRAAWQKAADALLAARIPFEINTGAISRGYRTTPYPSQEIMRYLAEHGGKAILTSDSHQADTVGFGFAEAKKLAESVGLKTDDFPEYL